MRALPITLGASLAGWFTGIVAGNIGGIILALVPGLTWSTMTMLEVVWSEVVWAFSVAIGMLPVCVLLVWPVVFHQLRKPVRWRPFQAFWIGGAGGVIAFALWVAALTPFNWSKPEDRAAAGLTTVAAFLIGAVTGSVAASMARSYPAAQPMSGSIPPPLPRSDH